MTCHLYRHFDADDVLLYVGISAQPLTRLCQHKDSRWFKEITRVAIEHCPTREYAEFQEAWAIAKEKPKYNINQPRWDNCPPQVMHILIKEVRAEAWVRAWLGEDVSSAVQICDEEEAEMLPAWYRRRKE